MKKIFILFSTFFLLNNVFASTEFKGGIFADQTWTKVNSPYIINGDVTLFPNVTLTVESGVEIKFASNYAFQIRGQINFNGALNDSIYLSALNIIPSQEQMSWTGFRVDCVQGGKVYGEYLNAQNAKSLFSLYADRNDLVIELKNSLFKNNNCVVQGIASQAESQIEITNCIFEDNTVGVGETDKLKVSNCTFSSGYRAITTHERPENTWIKNCEFFKFETAISTWGTVDNCYIHDNEEGIQIFDLVTITNCRIEYNKVGLKIISNPYQIINGNIYDNIICGNDYGIKSENQYSFKLGSNCWCVEDSELYKYIYDAYDDVNLGIVTVTPTQSGCTITPRTDPDPNPDPDPVTTSIDSQNRFKNEDLIVYPNPVFDKKIILEQNDLNGSYYEIFNANNQLISSGYIGSNTIDLNGNLSNGLYFIVVTKDEQLYRTKFIKL